MVFSVGRYGPFSGIQVYFTQNPPVKSLHFKNVLWLWSYRSHLNDRNRFDVNRCDLNHFSRK